MRRKLVIICLLPLLFSCKSKQPIITERTEYIETVRDSTVIIPADSSWLSLLLECDSIGQVRLKELLDYQAGQHVTPPKVSVKNNILRTECRVDSFGVFFSWVQKYGIQSREIEIPVEVPVEVPVRGWVWWVGLVTIITAGISALGFIVSKIPLLR